MREYCAVAGTERARELPTRAVPKARRVEQRTVYTVITEEAVPRVLLHKRPAKGLLSGLWELPNVLTEEAEPLPSTVLSAEPLGEGRHVFSHVEWRMNGLLVRVKPFTPKDDYVLVTAEELAAYALPTAFRTYTTALPQQLEIEEDVQ